MSKTNYCLNGKPVIDQVILYRKHHKEEDFLPILFYYDNYKDLWYAQLEDYMDRSTFDSEFDFKLIHAINSYSPSHAEMYAETKGLSQLGNFNRWFYKILMNWKSNVKTSAYRMKKRPSVTCPVCGRKVGRIDEEHLKHWKSKSDLPKYMSWKGVVYEVFSKPGVWAVSWGSRTPTKIKDLASGDSKRHADEKRRVRWPWRLKDGSRGVLCPFTKKIVPELNEEYIRSLPDEFSRFAERLTWDEFVSRHPTALIQSETYSIDRSSADGNSSFSETLVDNSKNDVPNYEDIKAGKVSNNYEHTFRTIDQCVKDGTDRDILKLIASGHSADDICVAIGIDKKEVKKRMRSIRDCKELEQLLCK